MASVQKRKNNVQQAGSSVLKVRKRDGTLEDFSEEKIVRVLERAFAEAGRKDGRQAKRIASKVVSIIRKDFSGLIPTTSDIDEVIATVLASAKLSDVARMIALHRQKHKEPIGFRTVFGVRDDIGLSANAILVLARRYLLKNEQGAIIETPSRMFRRVARAAAEPEALYKRPVKLAEEEFYRMMSSLEFLPNSPTLMNAGTQLGQLSACFVLPVDDSLKSIFDAVEKMVIIQQSGGGTGFNFSKLRPKGDIVRSTKGVASGPLSFMTVFDAATDVIKQGGKRRGANMGILSVGHPDIEEFITAKTREGVLSNFNLSVAVTDEFMSAVEKNTEHCLVNPRTGEVVKKVSARELFNLITRTAWQTGDPGMIFIDEINRHNPTPRAGIIECTNPCGEQPLLPYESCNLGSINLSKFVVNGKVAWERLRQTVRSAVHFLDNIIDANKHPFPEIEQATKANRKIGLGVMGFAEMLAKLGIPYDSNRAVEFAEKLMKFITEEARKKSAELGLERGSFPNFQQSVLAKKFKAMRNATVTTIAPTGSISIIANATSGIEPFFAVCFVREVLEGAKLLEVNRAFEEIAREQGFYSKKLMLEIARKGSVKGIKKVPKKVQQLFASSLDIKPEWHVRMQAAFQKYTDNAVSKTVNLPFSAKVDDVAKIYLLAWKLKCKGVTVYRYGSKKEQVLYVGKEAEHVLAESEFMGGCPGVCVF